MNIRIDKDRHIDIVVGPQNVTARWSKLAPPTGPASVPLALIDIAGVAANSVRPWIGCPNDGDIDEAIEDLLVKTEEAMGIDIIVEDDSVVATLERLASQGHGTTDLC